MPNPVITNVVQIVVGGTVTETGGAIKNFLNVFFYFQNPNVPAPQPAVNVGNQFLASVWTGIAAQLSVGYVGSFMTARYLDRTTDPFLTGNVPASGAIALPRLSAQQAIVFVLRSSTRGKNFRGNKHVGPLATATVTGDEIAPASLAAWTALLPSLIAPITIGGQTYSPCIVSRSLSQLRQDPVAIIGSPLSQALLNKTIGTMRRRKEKTVR
jgi:hypothetical protein